MMHCDVKHEKHNKSIFNFVSKQFEIFLYQMHGMRPRDDETVYFINNSAFFVCWMLDDVSFIHSSFIIHSSYNNNSYRRSAEVEEHTNFENSFVASV